MKPEDLFLGYKTAKKADFDISFMGAGMITNSVIFDNAKAEDIVKQLLTSAAGLQYGAISVSAKLHDGRVVEVSYSKTEHTRDLEIIKKPKQ